MPSTKLLTIRDILRPVHKASDFQTIYAGADPTEPSRLLVRSVVKLTAEDGHEFHCLEEATITKNFAQAFPTVQIQLKKLPDDYLNGGKSKIQSLQTALGYSLFYFADRQKGVIVDGFDPNLTIEDSQSL